MAAQSYSQDHHGSYPDIHWAGELCAYPGMKKEMFHCPLDKSAKTHISYGYSGLLIRADSNGVMEKDIVYPSQVGVICDACPSRCFPNGGLVGGGGLQPESTMAVTPEPRHGGGPIVGFADGHVECCQHGYNPKDLYNDVTRAFDMAGILGYVNNPTGGISDFPSCVTNHESVTVGGDPCTRAVLLAAAGVWQAKAKAPMVMDGFHGQYDMTKLGANYLRGIGDGKQPAGHAVPIARDLVVVIIAKYNKLQFAPPHRLDDNSVSVWDVATVQKAFTIGYQKDNLHAYTYDKDSGTRRFFTTHLGTNGQPLQFGSKTITVKDDYEMVKKVSDDPYGIGYCSSAIANPERVQSIGLRMPDGRIYLFPHQHLQPHKFISANLPDWPLTRTLYAECGGNAWRSDGTGIANVMLSPGAPGTKALQAGPLFRASFWVP